MDYQNICSPETGGILGGQNGIITVEHFDRGMLTGVIKISMDAFTAMEDIIIQVTEMDIFISKTESNGNTTNLE